MKIENEALLAWFDQFAGLCGYFGSERNAIDNEMKAALRSLIARAPLVDALAEAVKKHRAFREGIVPSGEYTFDEHKSREEAMDDALDALAALRKDEGPDRISLDGIRVHTDGRIELPNGDIVAKLPKRYRPMPSKSEEEGK